MHVTVGPASSWRWTLIAAAISIVVIVAGETLVHRISSREPILTYTAPESLPFNGGGKNVGIYQIEINNEGDAVADGLTGSVRIPTATIDNQRVSGPAALPLDAKAEGDTVHLSAPSLNPTETIHVSILASSSSPLPQEPDVSVRANGVTGVRQGRSRSRTMPLSFVPTLIIASATVTLMLFLQLLFRRRKGGPVAMGGRVAAGPVVEGGWRNVANVFWLGHDLLWTSNATSSMPRERILHGLRQSRHHAGQIGLIETDPYRETEALYSAVERLNDNELGQQRRTELTGRVMALIAKFGSLAKNQQPNFDPNPR